MDRDPILQPLAAVMPALDGAEELDERRCDRCRRVIEDHPTLDIEGRADRTLCRTCEAARFPIRARSSAKLTLVPPLDEPEA
jgi:hypothetical protein